MQALKLTVWAMAWAALGYLLRERIADRERLPAASAPPLALPRPEMPEDIDVTEELVTMPAPRETPAPRARAAHAPRTAHSRSTTAVHVLAVVVTGAAMGAFAVWMLSAVPGLL